MKQLYGWLFSILIVSLAGCATQPAANGEGGAAAAKADWYGAIVDGAFVEKHALLPRREGVTVIDSRPKARKYDPGHIPGAISIPESKFDQMVDALPADKSSLLLFYCGGTKCMLSHKSAFKAEKLGYSNIKVYAAGFPDWLKRGNLKGVSVEHLKAMLDSGKPMLVVDSRPARKFRQGSIPGAINLPDSQFDAMAGMLPADKRIPLFFYCGGYKCKLSPSSANKAKQLGYSNVQIVPAGYPAWKKAYGTTAKMAPVIESGKGNGTISIESFKKVMAEQPDSVLVVDVRDVGEYASGTIKGAMNIPINELEKEMDKLPADKTIVFVCGTGGRAGEAYDMVQMFMPDLKTYFLNAEVTFHKDGSYELKPLP